MNTSQDAILSALAQHSAYLYRTSSTEVNRLIKLFDDESGTMLSKLRDLLDDLTDAERIALSGGRYSTDRLREIRDLFASWQASLAVALPESFAVSATALAVHEAVYAAALLGEVVEPNAEKLYKAAKSIPVVGGALLDELFAKIKDDARLRVEYAIRQGIQDGRTNQQIVQRIKGKRELNYQDGILQQSRSDIDRTARTVRNHISTTAYMDTYKAIGYTHVKFVATLDGRVSKTCAGLDGEMWEIDDPAIKRPPRHPNCRSTLIGVDADGKVSGKRPFVADNRSVKNIPKDQRDGVIGQVDANTNFGSWFDKQDAAFQKEWLGAKRYELYKKGGYSLERFVDPTGQQYTLKELEMLDKQTFKSLGL